jgi:hypothetical protein
MSFYPSIHVWIAITAMLLSGSLSAQKHSPVSIGINASLDRPYQYRNTRWQSDPGFTLGINAHYEFNKRWSVQSGASFSDKVYASYTYYGEPSDPPTPYRTIAEIISNKTVQHRRFIDIPLKGYFTVGSGKFRAYVGAGVCFNVFIEEKTISTSVYDEIGETKATYYQGNKYEGQHRIYYSPTGSIGVQYHVSDRFYLRLEPVYQHLLFMGEDPNQGEHSFSANLMLNMYLK